MSSVVRPLKRTEDLKPGNTKNHVAAEVNH